MKALLKVLLIIAIIVGVAFLALFIVSMLVDQFNGPMDVIRYITGQLRIGLSL